MALLAGLRKAGLSVIGSGRALIVLQMATDAGGGGEVVVVVDVTVGTDTRGSRVRTGEYETGGGMVKGRIQPRSRVVTLFASLREVRADVVRIGRALEILQVARDACSICQIVVVVDVAFAALSRGDRVHAGQGKTRQVVIEAGIRPRRGVVALLTGLGEF